MQVAYPLAVTVQYFLIYAFNEVKLQQPPLSVERQTASKQSKRYNQPVSLRVKLLIGFSIVFSIVFAGAFYWFYTFATAKIMTRLKADMRTTLIGAAAGVDVDELMALYAEGERNPSGFSSDLRYINQLRWFQTVHSVEPRVWLYSYAVGTARNNRRIGAPAVKPDQLEIVYLTDLWSVYDPSKAARFLQADVPSPVTYQVLREGEIVETPKIYTDQWGTWLSAFAPLRDERGEIVAVLGLDIQADYVHQVQTEVRSLVLISFVITYAVLFILIYFLSGALTQQLTELTESAKRIGDGAYSLDLSSLTKSPFPDELNTLAQVFETMVDSIRTREHMIRQGKQAEYEMQLALQEERELNELKSRFVSMVSHELRTPLTVIRTSLELLERYHDVVTESKKREYFQRSQMAVQNMTQLLEDVLTIGKADAGRLEFNPTTLDLKQFCYEIVEEMQMGVGSNYEIAFAAEGDCAEVKADPKLLRSILTNLLSNAIKYSPIKSIVTFHLSCDQYSAVFVIQDEGIGIPSDDQPRLFELFHRASNVSTIRGTGLGLAIVRECVAHHQGTITFTSKEGIGTTFTVTLPLRSDLPPELLVIT
ncbi:MAG: HAMP domain-containing sensor histidine kinase [Oculatellaceae cyanobacterium bins.114]|nr:HAMP domain-containing sensor histidine kinase [Oculatellaceae cyanobacterium bins.114]